MATDSTSKKLESPSMANAFHFWQLAQEEYQMNNIYQQKDACEKANRAATEAIDTLLAFKGYSVPAGKPDAHVVQGESLEELAEYDSRIQKIKNQYSDYVHRLHGLGFYSPANPNKFKKLFETIESFLTEIDNLLKE